MEVNELPWIEDKHFITEAHFEAINYNNFELFKIIRLNLEKLEPIVPLIDFIIERLDTVATLTLDNRIWDAEIILRSAIETFVKFAFIRNCFKRYQSLFSMSVIIAK